MPKFWVFLTRQWLGLPDHLSWSWWRALGKSPWSACEELRTSILHYDLHPYPGQRSDGIGNTDSTLSLPRAWGCSLWGTSPPTHTQRLLCV
jgi:hypothetical protein